MAYAGSMIYVKIYRYDYIKSCETRDGYWLKKRVFLQPH